MQYSITKKNKWILIQTTPGKKEILCRHVRGVQWHPSLRAWFAPATLSTYRNLIELCADDVSAAEKKDKDVREWAKGTRALARRLAELQQDKVDDVNFPDDFFLPIKPFRHQSQAAAFCINLDKSALWLDLGLGKTFTSILVARLRHHKEQIQKVVVVAPLSLIEQWEEEIVRFSPAGSARVMKVNGKTGDAKYDVVSRFSGLPRCAPNKPHSKILTYLLITYESLKNYVEMLRGTIDMYILDESTKIKNPKAVRTAATTALCNTIPYGIELTGLAFLNNPIDLFSQFRALDCSVYGDNVDTFEDRYLDTFRVPYGRGKSIRGYKNMKELKSRAYYIAFSRNKSDCVDLPEKTYQVRNMPMYPEQAEVYNQIAEDISTEFKVNNHDVTVLGILAKLEKLQQVLAGFINDTEGNATWIGSPKYQEMVDIVSSSKDNFIIWGWHRCVLHKIKEVLTAAGIPSEIFSEQSAGGQQQLKKKFQQGMHRVIICQISSESRGLNFTSVNQVSTVYIENTLSPDLRWQSEGRSHRIGMSGMATYIDLVISGTLDESIMSILKTKLTLSKFIAQYSMEILLGKGDAIEKKRLNVGRARKKKDAVEVDRGSIREAVDLGIEGLDSIV